MQFDLAERKLDLILRLFVDPADEDYITARWCFQNGNFNHFYWCCAQSIEKYFKAILLFRDQSVSKLNHDLNQLLALVTNDANAKRLFERAIELSKSIAESEDSPWNGKPISEFINQIDIYGSPDNRYGYHGEWILAALVHILDDVCIRCRLLMSSQSAFGKCIFDNQIAQCWHDERPAVRKAWMLGPSLKLERLHERRYNVGESPELRWAFRNMNYAFFEDREPGERGFGGLVLRGSPLRNHLVELDEYLAQDQFIHADQLSRWRGDTALLKAWVSKMMKLSSEQRATLKM